MDIKNMINVLSSQGRFKTNELIYESNLYYFTSILMNMANFVKSDGSRINYYSLVLSGSGSGKDFAFDLVEGVFNLPEDVYTDNIMLGVEANNKDKKSGMYFNEETELLKSNAPKSITLGLEGTKEGLFSICKSQSVANFGSLNLTHGEFGDIITKSSELLSGLKELYDGKMSAKVIKSANVAKITDITVNLLAYGSHAGIAHEARAELMQLVKSGMFRRTYIIDLPNEELVKQSEAEDLQPLRDRIGYLVDETKTLYGKQFKHHKSNLFTVEFPAHPDAEKKLSEIYDDLLDRSNSDLADDIKKAEVGALTMIENLSYINAFLENKGALEQHHVEQAYGFYKRCRETTKETFKMNHPYMAMHKMLHDRDKLSISEMAELDNTVPTAKNAIADQVALLEETCYNKGQKLMIHKGKVTRYSIVELPQNDNSEMIVSVCQDNKGKFSIDYQLVGVPFFGKSPRHSIESLVTSADVESFLTVEVKPSNKAMHGHRTDDNAIEGQNMLAFDIDEGMTIDEAVSKLKNYTYILYTTKSHRKDKGGIICDRFRVLMPTKQKFFVDPEAHKSLYENVSDFIGFQVYDKSTRNISRFWFTSPTGDVLTNHAENIDVSTLMPETEAAKVFSQRLETIDEKYNDASVRGFYKWFFANTNAGNRNDHLHRLGCYMRDLGENQEMHIVDCNAMLDESLGKAELNHIIRSVSR